MNDTQITRFGHIKQIVLKKEARFWTSLTFAAWPGPAASVFLNEVKSIATIASALLFLLLSMGLPLNLHYCGGEVASITVAPVKGHCCCRTMAMPHGCCSDETVVVQLDTDPVVLQSAGLPVWDMIPALPAIPPVVRQIVAVERSIPSVPAHPPPRLSRPAWLLYGAFLFYG